MKSFQNYEKLSNQEELDLFLLNLKKYITNFQEYWKIYYDYSDLFFISAHNKFPFSTSFDRIFETIRFFENLIKVRQQQQQEQQQQSQRFCNTCSRSKRTQPWTWKLKYNSWTWIYSRNRYTKLNLYLLFTFLLWIFISILTFIRLAYTQFLVWMVEIIFWPLFWIMVSSNKSLSSTKSFKFSRFKTGPNRPKGLARSWNSNFYNS